MSAAESAANRLRPQSNLRVLCIDHEGGFGGSSRSLLHSLEAMDRTRIDLEVWCRRPGPIIERYNALGIPTRVIPEIPLANTLFRLSRNLYTFTAATAGILSNLLKWRALAAEISERFDVIHFNHPNLFLFAWFLRRRLELPFSFHMRMMLENLYEGSPGNRIGQAINAATSTWFARRQVRVLSRCADRLVFITRHEEDSYRRLGGVLPGTIIHNVASVPETGTPHPRLIDERRFKVASIENYRWSRGTDRLVEIADALARMGREDFVFVVAGDMTLPRSLSGDLGRIGQRSGTLADYVHERGLSSQFIFLGHVPVPDQVLVGCDILVSLARRVGPWGRSVIEAMASGKPVVGTGPYPGFVDDGRTGFYVKDFDSGELARRIVSLADDPEAYQRISEAARTSILALCDGKARAADLLSVWQTMTSET